MGFRPAKQSHPACLPCLTMSALITRETRTRFPCHKFTDGQGAAIRAFCPKKFRKLVELTG
jgi:hypothetical protein